ncbi:hypothetical protein GCM10023189_12550 [Nibrella saemangeumensis]|uniref:Secretion system C-terminal sorting domain-containing protein n=1 Tax=Nibrella saemangeumensis TaxID=1084526 RepID=A0ABP8MJQ1_9BACT
MKKSLLIVWIGLLGLVSLAQAQYKSQHTVRYMVTYEAKTGLFTAWVVPDYSTPNTFNPETEERGATAQFTLKVPKDFVLGGLKDIRGIWDKQARKFGQEAELLRAGADPGYAYYVIGKAPQETNYGEFKQGEPVALFTFKGQGGDPSRVQALEWEDTFVKLAGETFSLNVASSFYSRSGQAAKIEARPLEQFVQPTNLLNVMKELQERLAQMGPFTGESQELEVVAYPNPTVDVVKVKFFSQVGDEPVKLEVVDLKGMVKRAKEIKTKAGVNTVEFDLSELPGSPYFIKKSEDNNVVTKKVVKI